MKCWSCVKDATASCRDIIKYICMVAFVFASVVFFISSVLHYRNKNQERKEREYCLAHLLRKYNGYRALTEAGEVIPGCRLTPNQRPYCQEK
ncbi:hypothetical protein QR680_018593 [Steinernema hermaphroditum]|uniref:Uncharacterized protein n=1 Tax=Steinernema hermaphroditum TaxID=289476 RepID=A0AA39HIF8_9BILA|nr:hypothetical protein QR680_018593 [Steinernema hermaphroditum]